MDVLLGFADEKLPGTPLVVDQHRHHVAHLLDQLLFRLAERGLVGDLIEIAHRLRSLAIQAADGQRDLVQAPKHLVDLPGDHQRRQVEHHAHADAGAHVGRAGREIAKPRVKRIRHDLPDLLVDHLDLLPDPTQVEAAVDTLDAEVILFVDHQADLFELVDRHAAGPMGVGVFTADELPFDEKLPVDLLESTHIDRLQPLAGRGHRDPLPQKPLDVGAILLRGPAHEGIVRQVAGQPHATAHDDVRLGPRAAQPFTDRLGQHFNFHGLQTEKPGGIPSLLSLRAGGWNPAVLDRPDGVAVFRGFFVILTGDRLLHLTTQPDHAGQFGRARRGGGFRRLG